LLIQLTQTNKTEETWRRHPARLLSAYPKVVLPSEVQQEREVVTLAIDVSGSIDVDALKKFIALARSTPKTFKVETLLFNERCWEHDLNKAFPSGSNGTSFQCVEDFLLERRKYPKAVIVLTDGDGGEVEMKYSNRWVFMTYGNSNAPEIQQYKKFKIEEFMR
jgi:predicted metal-dependent peptidase